MSLASDSQPALALLHSAQRIGFAFSGGSARCAFQVGVIESLAEMGIRPALTTAVSSGAWNAMAIAAGTEGRLRHYWRAFARMPTVDLRNLVREHSPYLFSEKHRRTFSRYVGVDRLRRPEALPAWIGVTRLRDRKAVYIDARLSADPLTLGLASNYVPPFYTHAPRIDGERCGDGGLADNLPYRKAFEEGCDAVVLVTMKGESEGLPYRNGHDPLHEIPSPFRERTVVIRPRHRLPCAWTERRWPVLAQIIEIGRLRAREVILGETHPECQLRGEMNPIKKVISRFLMIRVLAAATPRMPSAP
ncbi:MAG TPA: patatin-like phospholipase family protein [Thermoanaerobaculia bacterium]|nr:patatin-like phospholipase family protein [Thermoanaerobaculia bacterium]